MLATPQIKEKVINAAEATANSGAINVQSSGIIMIQIATASSAECDIRVKATALEKPDFDSAATPANQFFYAACANITDETEIVDTITYSGTDSVKCFEVNVNRLTWIQIEITSYTAGAITIGYSLTDNAGLRV